MDGEILDNLQLYSWAEGAVAAKTQLKKAGALSDKALESFDREAALRLAPEEYLPDDYLASCRELVNIDIQSIFLDYS
ncbi:hypothetical protein HPP92_026917 [Vanilla planifolia]|uniref:Uncharacterized protein n=1 Tax=Vanilla planifolia TaxID=51239 RepID=A0A835U5M4_VANPL|nr:hypothetical protein HPP92_026917 [Vanilla planifolia]